MEKEIRSWVCKGGVLLHGPGDLLAENCFGIQERNVRRSHTIMVRRLLHRRSILPVSGRKRNCFLCRSWGCCVAKYEELELAQKMNTKYRPGMGAVYSFGIQIGASYAAKIYHMFRMNRETKKCILLFSLALLW